MCFPRSRSSRSSRPSLACLMKARDGNDGSTRAMSAARRRTSAGEKKVLSGSAILRAPFEDGLESTEVLAIRAPHRRRHEGGHDLRETGRLTPIPQRHAGLPAGGFPGVCRLHGKRALGGAHDEPTARDEVDDLVGICQAAAEKVSDERK